MIRDVAKQLLPLVNDKDAHDRLLVYAEDRIALLSERLHVESSLDRIREMQGAIRELKRFQTLRNEVTHIMEESRA